MTKKFNKYKKKTEVQENSEKVQNDNLQLKRRAKRKI